MTEILRIKNAVEIWFGVTTKGYYVIQYYICNICMNGLPYVPIILTYKLETGRA